jgi:hypothetical protein
VELTPKQERDIEIAKVAVMNLPREQLEIMFIEAHETNMKLLNALQSINVAYAGQAELLDVLIKDCLDGN